MRSQYLVQCFVAGVIFVFGDISFAQTFLADIVRTPGYTETQTNTGIAVQTVCGQLKLRDSQTLNEGEKDLFLQCRRMVQTAGELTPLGPAAVKSLGDNATEATLKQVLQQIAPEELAANSRTSIEATTKNTVGAIRGRLNALRAGAKGLSMNGIEYRANGSAYTSQEVFARKQRGGMAGADETVGSKLGVFVNGAFNKGDKNETSREDGFDFNNWSLLGGVDYRFTEKFVAGVALGYNQTKVDITRSQGKIDSDGWSVNSYATFNLRDFYLEGSLGYSRNSYDSDRNIFYLTETPGEVVQRVARGSTNGQQVNLSIGAGYDWAMGGLTITPFGRVEYIKLKIDAFDETGASGLNLHIGGQDADSTQSALGLRGTYAISTSIGALIPQASVEWVHEFANNSRNITARYVNDHKNNEFLIPTEQPDRNYFRIGLGLSAVFQKGWSGFVNYENLQGLSNITQHSILFGMRKEL